MIGFWFLMGGIFFGVGFVISAVFFSINVAMSGSVFGFFGAFLLLPLLFTVMGAIMLLYAVHLLRKKRNVRKKGTRYQAKIYGYAEDTSFRVNGQFTVNLKVHFFDGNHVEREAILATNLPQNANKYGIGMTIDIFEYQGQYEFDKESLRYEMLPDEEELMDDKPILPAENIQEAIRCPNCGASFVAVKGYASRCPYCGGYINT